MEQDRPAEADPDQAGGWEEEDEDREGWAEAVRGLDPAGIASVPAAEPGSRTGQGLPATTCSVRSAA